MSLRSGSVLAGKYKVEKVLGHGTIGTTYLSRGDEGSEKSYAIKIFDKKIAKDSKLVENFYQDYKKVRDANSKNIVQYHDFFELQDTYGYVTDYVDGYAFGALLASAKKQKLTSALNGIYNLVEALTSLHELDIIHRNLKPNNIFYSKDKKIKLVDFGFGSKLEDFSSEDESALDFVKYSSPETVFQSDFSVQSDIYSIAAIAFELLTGVNPHKGKNFEECLNTIKQGGIKNAQTHRSDCPQLFAGALAQALNSEPSLRYNSAADFFTKIKEQRNEALGIKVAKQQTIKESPQDQIEFEEVTNPHLYNPRERTIDHIDAIRLESQGYQKEEKLPSRGFIVNKKSEPQAEIESFKMTAGKSRHGSKKKVLGKLVGILLMPFAIALVMAFSYCAYLYALGEPPETIIPALQSQIQKIVELVQGA